MKCILPRRTFLQAAAAGIGSVTLRSSRLTLADEKAKAPRNPTRFQVACMTLPYSQYPLMRALRGVQGAGYKFVAWGTTHKEDGELKGVPVMPPNADPAMWGTVEEPEI